MRIEKRQVSVIGYLRDPDAAPFAGYRAVARIRSERDASIDALMIEVERVQSILERAQNVAMALGLDEEFHATLDATLTLRTRLSARYEGKGGDNPPPLHA